MRKARVIIIGGGASGLAAACYLSKRNIPFLLLEKNEKLGKKLYATGNGRCNLMNMGKPCYFGDEDFALEVLKNMSQISIREWLEQMGLVIFEEDMQRCYPANMRADCVVSCLESAIKGEVLLNTKAASIKKQGEGYLIESDRGDFFAERLIIATGGAAQKKLGADIEILSSLKALGLSIEPLYPALCPLECEKSRLSGLSGSRCMAISRLFMQKNGINSQIQATSGELLFTDNGVSGISIMQLAREARAGMSLSLDFSPLIGNFTPYGRLTLDNTVQKSIEFTISALKNRAKTNEDYLTGIFPLRLEKKLFGADKSRLFGRSDAIQRIAQIICDFRLEIKGNKGFDFAQVSAGGIKTRDISPKTMQSRLKNLYVLGEALDVDGDCGGFNLMFAFATGLICARSIEADIGNRA